MKEGRKDDTGKIQWSLLPVEAVESIVRVLMFGAKKYAAWNWVKVADGETRYYDACIRHLVAHKKGESLDPESKLPHLAHAGCCILFLIVLSGKRSKHSSEQ